jgi:hypothetical protein
MHRAHKNLLPSILWQIESSTYQWQKKITKQKRTTLSKLDNWTGFTKNIFEKHERRKYHKSFPTMFTSPNSEPERIFSRTFSLPFHPNLTRSLSKIFATYEIRLIESSSNYKIKNHFETTKTKIPEFARSDGIYQIFCKTQRCGYKYIGQSRQSLRAFKNKE